MSSRVRRRDRALAGEQPRSRTPLIVGIVVAIVLLLLLWIALQTLGGHSTKG
jgi:hypothetical protein